MIASQENERVSDNVMLVGLEQKLRSLDDEQRLTFYEVLSHKLTISIRVFCFEELHADMGLAPEECLEHIKWINEILHRVTSKAHELRLKNQTSSDENTIEDMRHWIGQNPGIKAEIQGAINSALDALSRNSLT